MAERFRETAAAFSNTPCAFVKRKIAQGDFRPSFLSNLLQAQQEPSEDSESVLKWSAASLYSGGADTVRPSPGPY